MRGKGAEDGGGGGAGRPSSCEVSGFFRWRLPLLRTGGGGSGGERDRLGAQAEGAASDGCDRRAGVGGEAGEEDAETWGAVGMDANTDAGGRQLGGGSRAGWERGGGA